jgi:aminopeptidase N
MNDVIGFSLFRNHLRTQLEPVGARRVFPCFDEPDLKAAFQIAVGRKGHQRSYSNMPLKQTIEM